VPVHIRRVTRLREYVVRDAVQITGQDFFEIALACHMFAGDVASKLPVRLSTEVAGAAV
jgi:hypothetical protein